MNTVLKENLINFSRSVVNHPTGPISASEETAVNEPSNPPHAKINMFDDKSNGNESVENQESPSSNTAAYWFGIAIKNIVVVLGLIAIVMGVLSCLTTKFKCLLAGIILA